MAWKYDTHLTGYTFAFLYLREAFDYIRSSLNLDAFPIAGYNF